jgi:hypothetical protein
MKRVPIDKLLEWTLNDELPKGRHVLEDIRRILERVDRPGPSRRTLPPSMLTGHYLRGEPHADAVTIARAMQRFSVCAGLSSEKRVRALLGPLADLEPSSIPAALAIRPDVAALMITCAVLKRPPHVPLTHPKPGKTFHAGDRRKPLVLREDVDGKLVVCNYHRWTEIKPAAFYGMPRSPITWSDPTIKVVAEQRAEYTIWWRALTMLQGQLAGRLKEYEAAPLTFSPTPWLMSAPAPAPIHRATDRAPLKKLPLQPCRGIVAGPAVKGRHVGGAVSPVSQAEANACQIGNVA